MVSKKSGRKNGKRYHYEFSVLSLFLWSLCLFFLLGWIFVLGILVGRGFLPESMKSISELKDQLARLQGVAESKKSSDPDILKGLDKDPEFAFYEKLSTKKEEVAKQGDTKAEKPRISPKSTKQAEAQESSGAGMYTLQLASLDSEKKAAAMVAKLVGRGYAAYLHRATIKGRHYYRVRCGRFANEKEAVEYAGRLAKKEGLKGFISRMED